MSFGRKVTGHGTVDALYDVLNIHYHSRVFPWKGSTLRLSEFIDINTMVLLALQYDLMTIQLSDGPWHVILTMKEE